MRRATGIKTMTGIYLGRDKCKSWCVELMEIPEPYEPSEEDNECSYWGDVGDDELSMISWQ